MPIEPPDESHPDPERIARVARGETAPSEDVVRHLLRGCPSCRKVVRPVWYQTGSALAGLLLGISPGVIRRLHARQ